MKELITKNLDVKDKSNYEFHKIVDSKDNTFLSRPISLRLWSSFFVILPIFIQAPWVRFEPISALCFTFIILLGAFVLYKTNDPIRIIKVKQSALIGSNLTQGAWTNIGKITKKEDHNLKEIGLDKKVLSFESTILSNSKFNLSFTSRFFVINSFNE